MNTNDNHKQMNIDEIRNLLSPYIDGEVTDAERALVEQYLNESPELRQDLESLQQTVSLLSALPKVPAPRPFTLSEADVEAIKPAKKSAWFISSWFTGWIGAGIAALLVMVVGLTYVMQFDSMSPQQLALAPEQETASMAIEAESANEEPSAENEDTSAKTDAPAEEAIIEEFVEEAPAEAVVEAETELAEASRLEPDGTEEEQPATAKSAANQAREKVEMPFDLADGGASATENSAVEATTLEADESSVEEAFSDETIESAFEEEETSTVAESADTNEAVPFSYSIEDADADLEQATTPVDAPAAFDETEDSFTEDGEAGLHNTAESESEPIEQQPILEAQPTIIIDDEMIPTSQSQMASATSTPMPASVAEPTEQPHLPETPTPTPDNSLATPIMTPPQPASETTQVATQSATTNIISLTDRPVDALSNEENNLVIAVMVVVGLIVIAVLFVGWLKRR